MNEDENEMSETKRNRELKKNENKCNEQTGAL